MKSIYRLALDIGAMDMPGEKLHISSSLYSHHDIMDSICLLSGPSPNRNLVSATKFILDPQNTSAIFHTFNIPPQYSITLPAYLA